jgi:hypothetical protein
MMRKYGTLDTKLENVLADAKNNGKLSDEQFGKYKDILLEYGFIDQKGNLTDSAFEYLEYRHGPTR